MSGDPYDDGILGDRFEDEDTTSDLKPVKIDPDHIAEEDGIRNPFCNLSDYDVKCHLNFPQCYNYNRKHKRCKHYRDELSEEQDCLRLMEIERLDQIKSRYERKVKRINQLKKFLSDSKDIIPIIGCGGCLIWVALMIVVLAFSASSRRTATSTGIQGRLWQT